MSKKYNHKKNNEGNKKEILFSLHPEAKKSIGGIILVTTAMILVFASFNMAGIIGRVIHLNLIEFIGWGYYLLISILVLMGLIMLLNRKYELSLFSLLGALILVLSFLAIIDIFFPGSGGFLGRVSVIFTKFFDKVAGGIIAFALMLIGFIITFNIPLRPPSFIKFLSAIKFSKTKEIISEQKQESVPKIIEPSLSPQTPEGKSPPPEASVEEKAEKKILKPSIKKLTFKNYIPPPIELLRTGIEKPTVGDLRANANIIKRTLEGFGIPVEMGEITIGPKITRYTLKPAEGMKLSRITALNQDLALALAAHPLRIEAPIPGKSLVGIEVPNKTAALVRLGSLMAYPEFLTSGSLAFALGRDINGEPIFANIDKMPHLLICGSTGSGKSIALHSLLISLLYKNSPDVLQLILIDPKRVELSIYEGLPHLITPVIIEGKKAIGALKFAIQEMETRYETLLKAGRRDISGYNNEHKENPMPYLIIIIDEMADLMAAYGREVEGSIVRLTQMARATGIHLIVSTQRPSVEVITGLIKANITTRMALQVASQVDSRTILDMAGAEKLLGGGDMLFLSSQFSKPRRIQGAYVSEEEIKSITEFIVKNNDLPEKMELEEIMPLTEDFLMTGEEDELYFEAIKIIVEAKKASASLLQRRLKLGYARAARLLDIMEARGFIGPADGAKPREIYLDKINNG